jgi:hypothetical protein
MHTSKLHSSVVAKSRQALILFTLLRATPATVLKNVPNLALGLQATSSNEVEIATAHRSSFTVRQAPSDSLQPTQRSTLLCVARILEIMRANAK